MKKHAFTLIELMVLMMIMGILMMLIVPGLLRLKMVSNDSAAKEQLRTIGVAFENYAGATGLYPSNVSELTDPTPPYMSKNMFDGVGHEGYNFSVSDTEFGTYTVKAVPIECNSTGSKSFTLTPGVYIKEIPCIL